MRSIKNLIGILMIAALGACTPTDRQAPAKQGAVIATKDFQRHFGPAPKVDTGTAYAFVIYFPAAKDPGKVIPFPFFSFDEASLKRVALVRLIGGMGDISSYQGEISQPFPAGTRVLDVSQSNGLVSAGFSKELAGGKPDPLSEPALTNAIVLTLKQFEGVEQVAIRIEGVQSTLDKARKADESAVLELPAPRLLSVTAMRDKGASEVEEVDAFFDRPVQIKELVMSGADGKPFQGDTYQSVFDMAAVLKPKDPAQFKAGMPVKVRWSVTDNLGRSASGESEMALEVKEH